MAYTVTAKKWEHGWELRIDGIGVTQSRLLSDAESMVRDYLAADDISDAETAEVTIRPDLIARCERSRGRSSALHAVGCGSSGSRPTVTRSRSRAELVPA